MRFKFSPILIFKCLIVLSLLSLKRRYFTFPYTFNILRRCTPTLRIVSEERELNTNVERYWALAISL